MQHNNSEMKMISYKTLVIVFLVNFPLSSWS